MNMNVKLDAGAAPAVPERAAEPSGLGCLVIVARHHGLHLTVPQLVHDNVLANREVSVGEIVKCATSVGLKTKTVNLDWDGLGQLRKVLPAIVRLKSGGSLVLLRLEDDAAAPRAVLQDPNAAEDALLVIDRARFEDAWTGEVLLIKRNYDLTDEEQPFKLGLIVALIFRERRIVRDTAISAVVLGLLALSPIIFFMTLQNKVLFYKAYSTFYVLCVAMLVLVAFEAIFGFLRQYLVVHLTTRVDVKLTTYIFEKVLNLPMDFFERNQIGMIARDMREVYKIRQFLTGQLFGTVLDSTTLIFFLPVMFFFSPILTAVVLAFCGIIVVWIIVMLPTLRRKTAAVQQAEGQQGAFLVQTLIGMRTVKSLALDARQRSIWDVHVARVAKLRREEGLTAGVLQAVVRPLERFAVSGTYALGVYFVLSTGDISLTGSLFAFLMLSQRVAAPLMQMAKLINQFDEARVAMALVGNLVNRPPEEGRTGHGVRTPLKGEVRFSQVRFKYQGAISPALKNVSFEVPHGTTLGIMGKSGSGKTTITRLLQRLHSDYEGLIKIDGIDVREYDVDHLRRSLGVVLQENFLFSGTIRENVSMGKSDASFDEVVRAARLAGAEEFIDKLPRGYETFVYEGSPNLSGGQRQRLAIARALITNPAILILDEATSALDAESEAIVTNNIARIAHGRTMIIISHRLSSLVSSDAILVLDQGEVVDIGKHAELLARCDIYSDLWYQQNRHVASKPDKTPFKGPSLVP
jgi:subfamily B ATP-binding cassette protein HlyB/CyaB